MPATVVIIYELQVFQVAFQVTHIQIFSMKLHKRTYRNTAKGITQRVIRQLSRYHDVCAY